MAYNHLEALLHREGQHTLATDTQFMNNLKLMEILSRVPLFKDLQPIERESVLKMKAVFTPIKSREVFIKEGAHEPWFYIILAGKATVTHRGRNIGTLVPGQFIGEVGFICKEPRSASVVADDEMVVMKIDYEAFRRIPVRIRESIKDKIISGLVDRTMQLNEKVYKQDEQIEKLNIRIADYEAEAENRLPGRKKNR